VKGHGMSRLENFSKEEIEKLNNLEKLIKPDSLPEYLFEEISRLSKNLFNVHNVVIRIITSEKKWFKSNESFTYENESEVDSWLKNASLRNSSHYEVPDAFETSASCSTNDANSICRYFLVTPIYFSNNEIIGALCLIDDQQINLDENQKFLLKNIANIASEALQLKNSSDEQVHNKSARLSAIVDSSEDAIISKTLDGIVVSWNLSAQNLFGYTADEMIGKPITALFPKDRLEEEDYFIKQIKNNKHIKHFETERLHKSGKLVYISVSLSPIRDLKNQIIGISKIARDISLQKLLQQTLIEEHERLRVTMDSIGDAVITTDQNGIVTYQNPVAEKLTGLNTEESKGLPLHKVFKIVNEKSRLPVENPVEICINENRTVGLAHQTLLISNNGAEYGIEDSAAPIRDSNGNTIGAVLVFHDVTAQRQMANEMTYRATHDSLTGLLNRIELEDILAQLLIDAREPKVKHALMYIDLDQFKIINDTCGHGAGDKLLREVSRLMESCIRSTDKIARIGGDEFAVILEKCEADAALKIAELLCKSVDEYRFQHFDKRFHIGASVGLVIIDKPWPSVTSLMQAADNACYDAKNDGRNRVKLHFEAGGIIDARHHEMHWISSIEDAFENDKFVLYCQRILPFDNTKFMHGEVLIRMKDGKDGLISPGLFLPVAERFHIASRIDRWVVSKVFAWLKIHQNELSHLQNLSINLSGQSLSDNNFLNFVVDHIEMNSVDCSKVCFEITETAAITNILEASRFIEVLKIRGIKFSLDDFGSGVSSFGYLKNLSVDYLKIDGQFVRGIVSNLVDKATVRCILEIAQASGKQTIAECVEDESVENLLKEMNVDFIQGYLRHKPSPIDEILVP
jgi:diguanylate cyclase (GGDEF)-like protein/PAS domain S-box-containing protein